MVVSNWIGLDWIVVTNRIGSELKFAFVIDTSGLEASDHASLVVESNRLLQENCARAAC